MQVFRFLLFPKYFILFIAVVSEIIFFISLLASFSFRIGPFLKMQSLSFIKDLEEEEVEFSLFLS